MRVKQLLKSKDKDVYSIAPDATVYDALKLMAKKEVGALVVLEKDKMVGILSERDYSRKIILSGKKSRYTLVKDIMTTDVKYATPDDKLSKCFSIMTKKHFRHLPVLKDEKVVAVLSIADLRKNL